MAVQKVGLLLLLTATTVRGHEKLTPGDQRNWTSGNIAAQVNVTGGAVSIGNIEQGVNDLTGGLSFNLLSVTEVDSTGDAVGINSNINNSHSLDTTSTIFGWNHVDPYTYQGLNGLLTNGTARPYPALSPAINVTVVVRVYTFFQEGTFNADDESTAVANGTVKISLEVHDWPWCTVGATNDSLNDCRSADGSQQNGSYLDLQLQVQGPATRNGLGATKTGGFSAYFFNQTEPDSVEGNSSTSGNTTVAVEAATGKRRLHDMIRRLHNGVNHTNTEVEIPSGYDFSYDGHTATVDFSNLVYTDEGGWAEMPDNGASFEAGGSGYPAVFTVRFPRSSGMLLYDPTATIGRGAETAETQEQTSPTATATDTSGASASSPALSLMALSLLALPLLYQTS